jgi:hypothetical protein
VIAIVNFHVTVTCLERIVDYSITGFVVHDDLDHHLMRIIDMLNLNMISISPITLKLCRNAQQIILMSDIKDIDLQVLDCMTDGFYVNEIVDYLDIS